MLVAAQKLPRALVRQWGRNVKAERVRQGITQEELARRSRLALRTVTNAERGNNAPRDTTRTKLSRALRVKKTDLFPDGISGR